MSALGEVVGTLAATPFADLLIRAHDTRATGTLVLEDPLGTRHGVYFSAGQPERAKVSSPGAHLGEVLVERGDLSVDLHRVTLERARAEHVLHGRLLVAEGIVSENAIRIGLREQLMRQLVWLFGQPGETRYGYFAGSNFLADWGAPSDASIELLELLWLGIRDHAKGADLETTLARHGSRRIELRRDLPLDHFAFLGDDADVIERLRARPTRIRDLLAEDPGALGRTKRVLCLLVLTRSLELDVPSAPPLGLKDSVRTVVPPAPRLPTFSDSSARQLPREQPRATPPTTAPVLAFGAQSASHRAEVLLGRGQLAAALREARAALESEPEKPENVALHAYLELLQPKPDIRKVLTEVERAVQNPTAGVKAHWYRGLALKRLGRHASALQEFRYVVEEDPSHIDAAREVHIYEGRLRNSPKDRPSLAPESERRRDSGQLLDWAKRKLRLRH